MAKDLNLITMVTAQLERGQALSIEQARDLISYIEALHEHRATPLPPAKHSGGTGELLSQWKHNIREFYERQYNGWRAIVSSDTEDTTWTAYIERGEVRIYASPSFPFLRDALRWCEDQIDTQNNEPATVS